MKTKWIALIFIVCVRCQSWHTLRVSFDSADKVKPGDIVMLGSTKIGAVKNVKPDALHRSATITLLIDRSVHIPSSSGFLLAYDTFGTPFISISPSGEQEPIDWKQVQHGKVVESASQATSPGQRMPPSDGLRPSKNN